MTIIDSGTAITQHSDYALFSSGDKSITIPNLKQASAQEPALTVPGSKPDDPPAGTSQLKQSMYTDQPSGLFQLKQASSDFGTVPANNCASLVDGKEHLLAALKAHPRNIDYDLVIEQQQRIADTWPVATSDAKQAFSKFCHLYDSIKAFNLPNFLGAQITLESALNLNAWDQKLSEYHDKELCVFLRYGWPVGYNAKEPPTSVLSNHQSAKKNLPHVLKFIETELSHGALVGPFKNPPFAPWTRVSPLLTRPKKDSQNKRIIVDLSFPDGSAVNTGIDIT